MASTSFGLKKRLAGKQFRDGVLGRAITNLYSNVEDAFVIMEDFARTFCKAPCRLATATSIDMTSLSALTDTVDGVTVAVGDRILVKNATANAKNGIYEVVSIGTGADGVWARTADYNIASEIKGGQVVVVTAGNTLADTLWIMTAADPATIDVSAITYGQGGVVSLSSAAPAAIGTAAAGSSGSASKADHVHAHGNQSGGLHAGTLHEAATTTVSGFLSSGDKVLLNAAVAQLGTGNVVVKTSQRLQHGDLAASATSEVISMTLPANVVVLGAFIELDTPFSGGASSACVARIGITGDTDAFSGDVNIFTGASAGIYRTDTGSALPIFTAGGSNIVKITVTSTDDNVVNLAAGDLYVHVLTVALAPST